MGFLSFIAQNFYSSTKEDEFRSVNRLHGQTSFRCARNPFPIGEALEAPIRTQVSMPIDSGQGVLRDEQSAQRSESHISQRGQGAYTPIRAN